MLDLFIDSDVPRQRSTFTGLYGVTSLKSALFIFTAESTSNLTEQNVYTGFVESWGN
jgi:hypothetical protein